MILAGDVGGTKILLEAGEFSSGRWKPALARRYMLADFASMEDVLGTFLDEWERERPRGARLTSGAIGVAGPCIGNCVTMTNRPWRLDGEKLAARFGIANLRLLNDLEAAAHGLDLLAPRDFITYQTGKAVPGCNRVLMGVGGTLPGTAGIRHETQDDDSRYATQHQHLRGDWLNRNDAGRVPP